MGDVDAAVEPLTGLGEVGEPGRDGVVVGDEASTV
jgi:hypothetical protein